MCCSILILKCSFFLFIFRSVENSPRKKKCKLQLSSTFNKTKNNILILQESSKDEGNDLQLSRELSGLSMHSDNEDGVKRDVSRNICDNSFEENNTEKNSNDISDDDDDNDDDNDDNNSGSSQNHDLSNTDGNDANDNTMSEQEKFLNAIKNSACLDGKFFKVDMELSSFNSVHAICNFCDPPKKFKGSMQVTSNFIKHLKTKHSKSHEEYQKYADMKRKGLKVIIDKKRWKCKFNQDLYEKNITNVVLKFMLPFRIVEDPTFRKIFDDFEFTKGTNQLKHLTRFTLAKKVNQRYKELMAEVRNKLLLLITDGGYVCTTADMWSSNQRRYLGVTVSWIEPKTYTRKSAAIACRRFPGTHSFDAIAKLLSGIHESFGLSVDSIQATVTDNASNFSKAFKEFGVGSYDDTSLDVSEKNDGNADEDDDIGINEIDKSDPDKIVKSDDTFGSYCKHKLPRHVKCASHTLNLIASEDVTKAINNDKRLKRQHKNVMDKCSSLWKLLRSPKIHERLKSTLGISLRRPVVTRWNSTYDCLKQVISIKDKLINEDFGELKEPLCKVDFEYLEEFLMCSTPLALAIDKLQADQCYYGCLLPQLVSVQNDMNDLLLGEKLRFCHTIVVTTIKSIERRFQNQFDFSLADNQALIAAISHPLFKGQWLASFPPDVQKLAHEKFSETVSKEASIDTSIDVIDNGDADNQKLNFGNRGALVREFKVSSSQGQTAAEVDCFLKSSKFRFSILDDYPTIRQVFLKFNTPLPSSAPVERLFSHATMMNLPKYNRLSDEHFEQRVLFKANSTKSHS
ncbi:zinc finger BED domain-containing protein 4-like [Microplitis mediator]|uniref:zinc finger BED domain-containing protein 4-like n=1 Tax=Microplitis mediator TaxID=375433 RepID=UPI0025553B76|nr:zinc finger BED domain-containing protein 4-like [Microplitis mediator]